MTLAPFDERTAPDLQVDAIIRRVQPQLAALPGATAFAFNLPPIIGLGSTGGFEYQLQDLAGRDVAELAQVMRAVIIEANQQPELARVFSTFAADTPQLYLDLDRNKAETLGVNINDVFTALQGTLGGLYVNDFNLFGRTWQVNIQADKDFRSKVDDIFKVHVRNAKGEMVPIRSLASVRLVLGPSALIRYNLYRSVTINGSPAPGYSTGDALAAMERLSARVLPPGYGFEWTGTALQEKEAAGQTTVVLALAILFAYLFLVALYESWNIPIPVLLSVVGRGHRRDRRGDRRAPELRPLRPDRPGRADRARRQERDPDRRVRDRAARAWQVDRRGRDRGLAPAVPAGDDDQLRLHRGPGAAGDRERGGLDQPPLGRHAGVRRHAGGSAARGVPDPDAVRGLPVAAREGQPPARGRAGGDRGERTGRVSAGIFQDAMRSR